MRGSKGQRGPQVWRRWSLVTDHALPVHSYMPCRPGDVGGVKCSSSSLTCRASDRAAREQVVATAPALAVQRSHHVHLRSTDVCPAGHGFPASTAGASFHPLFQIHALATRRGGVISRACQAVVEGDRLAGGRPAGVDRRADRDDRTLEAGAGAGLRPGAADGGGPCAGGST